MEQRPKRERQEELNRVRDLHLLRDERDREVQAEAGDRAGGAVLRVSQLLAAVCLLRGEPAWMALLSVTFVSAAVRCFCWFRSDRERAYLLLGLAASAAALGLLGAFLFREGETFGVGRLAAFGVLYVLLRGVAGLLFVGLLLAVFWVVHRVRHLEGEQWEAYFQSVSTVGLLLRGGSVMLAALGLTGVLGWRLFALLGFPAPGQLTLVFLAAAGAHLIRRFGEEREDLVRKLLRLKV
jgi:hypothetical protein